MPAPVKCDQCGCTITDEDFREGGAFRDRADVLCAKCFKMYQEDERRREREKKLAKVETSINKTRATARSSGKGVERRARRSGPPRGADGAARGTHRRGATRKTTTGRKGAGRRAPEAKSSRAGVFIGVAVAAFIIAASVIYLLKKDGKTPRRGARPPGVSSEVLPPPPPPPTRPKTTPEPSRPARKRPGSEKREFGKSLFGPTGEHTRRKTD